MTRTLHIIRGLPGSGKSTLGRMIAPKDSQLCFMAEADDYFVNHLGEYIFDPTKIHLAHRECFYKIEKALINSVPIVVVSNTFTRVKEFRPYVELAKKYNYAVKVITCQADFGSIHDVPAETMERMRSRWEEWTP